MNKYLAIAAVGAAPAFVAPANAQHYCGHDVEPAITHTVVLPHTGASILGIAVVQSGLDNGDGSGVAVQEPQRYCGQIPLHLYTGNNPTGSLYIEAHLDPTVVSQSVVAAACVVTPDHTGAAYYEGYADAGWPALRTFETSTDLQYTTTDPNWYSGASHIVIPVLVYSGSQYYGGPLNSFTTYTLHVLCPPKLH
jgi:hypothetical protein